MGSTDAIAGATWCIGLPIVLLVLVALIVVPGVAIGYGDVAYNSTCFDEALVLLPTWLVVYGAASLGSIVYLGAALGAFASCSSLGVSSVTGVVAPLWLFHLCWAIVGSVSVWRDATACSDAEPELYRVSEAVVCLECIGLAIAVGVVVLACRLA